MCSMPSTRAAGRGLIQKPASRRPNGCRNLPSSCVAFPEAQKRDPATFSIVFKTSHSRSSFWHWDRSHSRPTPAIVARLPELPRALSMRSGGKVTSSILIDAASWGVAAALPGPTKRLAAGPVGLMQAALDIAPLSVDERRAPRPADQARAARKDSVRKPTFLKNSATRRPPHHAQCWS